MKSKLNRKLITVNAVILVVALCIFCVVVSLILKGYMHTSLGERLLIENKSAHRLAMMRDKSNSLNGARKDASPWIFESLTESASLIFVSTDIPNQYRLVSRNDEKFEMPEDIAALIQEIQAGKDDIAQIRIDGKEYLATMSKVSKGRLSSGYDSVAVSFLPLDSVQTLIGKYIMALVLVIAILGGVSIFVMNIFSRKITDPINRVTALTHQYANKDFRERYVADTGDEVEELSKAVDEMASSLKRHDEEQDKLFRHISHEMKTPLTAIYGYAEGMKTGVFTNYDEVLDIIMDESLRMKRLTEDIIFLSKLESQVELFEFALSDIGDVMERAIQSVESIAILNDTDIVYTPQNIDPLQLDPDKMFRAIVNLLSNCLKHTKDVIEIEISEYEGHVKILIADNGEGFDEVSIACLTNGLAKEKSDGSGIGLSIVHQILKKHKGKLSIQNCSDRNGAMFLIHLPK